MGDMRRKGTGTYDHSTGSWRLRGKRLQMTTNQLGELFGVELPKSERATLPFWQRYLSQSPTGTGNANGRTARCNYV